MVKKETEDTQTFLTLIKKIKKFSETYFAEAKAYVPCCCMLSSVYSLCIQ